MSKRPPYHKLAELCLGEILKFLCCGVEYNTNDPATYWCIEKDIIREKNFTEKKIKKYKVHKQVVYTLLCVKNGCTKVEVIFYGLVLNPKTKKKRKTVLKRISLKGKRAVEYLSETANIRERQPQIIPGKNKRQSKYIPTCYGKALSATTQIPRYLNETGNGGKTIKSELKTFFKSSNI